MDLFKSIFDITKLPAKFIVVFAVVSGFLTYATPEIISQYKLTEFSSKYGAYISLIFLLTTAITIVNIIIYIYNIIGYKLYERKQIIEYKRKLNNLSIGEKAVLREFYLRGERTIDMPMNDAVVSGLMHEGIIQLSTGIGGNSTIVTGMNVPIMKSKLTDKYLTLANIEYPENPNSENNKEFLLNHRPNWTQSRNPLY